MSSCLFGQSGPLERYAGFGTMGASLAGFFHLTGWPDRPPCGPFGAYSDYMSPRFALCAVLAALDHRRRTGEGQYLDFAQAEACVHFLSPACSTTSVNGRTRTRPATPTPRWRRTASTAATATTPWVAIACRDDADWRALAAAHRPSRPGDADDGERLARGDELDAHRHRVDGRPGARRRRPSSSSPPACPPTACRTPASASPIPQLRHAGHWVTLPHPEHGTIVVEDSRIRLSRHAGRRQRRRHRSSARTPSTMLTGDARLRRRAPRRAVRRRRVGLTPVTCRGWRGTSR